ncbi:FmdB family zinc ribbon protein [Streptomonospora wellingtoniae]|uniref:FmdB family zinc ribbon protein n=1 Tax=Streptomonospora wellingtoniae TaxID=3075544 RepID=A0ABU2KVE5_9ACTN|nr:FmdB family zinc ribbon protein [Streptomonospora sp. DSM 45055]MDT0303161.1 FmdB family zinc ribbon protein [Streptomonospora sp. DSM 45055]
MPTYQYACTECGSQMEVVQSFSDDSLTVCPECQGRLRKVYSAVGIVFKGSGFYRTDSSASSDRSSAAASGASAEGDSGATAKSESASSGSDSGSTSGSDSSSAKSESSGSGGTKESKAPAGSGASSTAASS